MSVKIVNTGDNSNTIYSERFKEHYHSKNGAVTESEHIFINLGLRLFKDQRLNILEVGYGTGLNAIMTFLENGKLGNKIFYHGIELYPLDISGSNMLGYSGKFSIEHDIYLKFHTGWGRQEKLNENFYLFKENVDFINFSPVLSYDIIYFDAFSPETQPEMWHYENLKKITDNMNTGAVFVTYCSKGTVKQNLRKLGLEVKRFSGPVGKRHVISAVKK